MTHLSNKAEQALSQIRDDQPQNLRSEKIQVAEVFATLAVAEALQKIATAIEAELIYKAEVRR